jgi:D-alanyl-D-alanine carboxypeptidase
MKRSSSMNGIQHPSYIFIGLAVAVGMLFAIVFYYRPKFLYAPKPPQQVNTVMEFEGYVNQLIEFGDPPGISIVVVKDGIIKYEQGFGTSDSLNRIPATPETVYHWWSISKLFTVIATLQLQEQGLLNIQDPVANYLPFFRVEYPSSDSQQITIQHLLSHSSGMPDAGNEILGWIHYDGDPALNQTEFLKEILPRYSKLVYEPGTEGRYSNIGYIVLSAVIEAVSHQPYEEYIVDNILKPLEMEHTNFVYTPEMQAFAASGSHPIDVMGFVASYSLNMDRAIQEKRDGRLWFNNIYSNQTAPTGLIGSPSDMARFMMAILNKGVLNETRIVSAESIELMQTRQIAVTKSPAPISNLDFGLGWFIIHEEDRIALAHGGQGTSFVSFMKLYPEEGLGILAVANSTYLGRNFGFDIVNMAGSLDW